MTAAAVEICVPISWGRIRGKVWGPDNGRPVLCLHGWADNCGSFNTLIPLLPTECRYVALDLAGHGLSSHRPLGSFYCPVSYAMDVRRVVEALQLKKFSIIGHSMGGHVAGVFTALFPEMVEVLVFLDNGGLLITDSKETTAIMRQSMDAMMQFEETDDKNRVYTLEQAVERLMTACPDLSEQSALVLLERGLVKVEGGFEFSRDIRVNFKHIARSSLEQCLDMQSRIQAPVLIILAHDGFGGNSAKDELASALLRSWQERKQTVVRVAGGHHVHLTNSEVVAPFISDFLRTKLLPQTPHYKHKL